MSDYVHIREVVQPADSLQKRMWEFYEQKILVYENLSGHYQPIAEDSLLRWEISQQTFVQQTNLILSKELSSDQNRLLKEDFISHNKRFPEKPLIPSTYSLLAYASEFNAQLDEHLNSDSPQNSGASFLLDTHPLNVFSDMLERRLRGSAGGQGVFPDRWVEQLYEKEAILSEIEQFVGSLDLQED